MTTHTTTLDRVTTPKGHRIVLHQSGPTVIARFPPKGCIDLALGAPDPTLGALDPATLALNLPPHAATATIATPSSCFFLL